MSSLFLPDGVRVAVWRLVKAQLKNDPVLAQASVDLIFFDGTRDATQAIQDADPPAIIFAATPGPLTWENERQQYGALIVDYQIKIAGTDDEDVLNLQEAIEAALYPNDDFAFGLSLIKAGDKLDPPINGGAVTGQPEFTRPAALAQQAAGRGGILTPTGQFTILVNRPFPA